MNYSELIDIVNFLWSKRMNNDVLYHSLKNIRIKFNKSWIYLYSNQYSNSLTIVKFEEFIYIENRVISYRLPNDLDELEFTLSHGRVDKEIIRSFQIIKEFFDDI